jgi:hypothetical protein
MRSCPACGSPEVVTIQTCRRASGNRWRRHHCSACDHRFSSTETAAFPPLERPSVKGRACYEQRSLTDRQAALIMLSPESSAVLAERYGITRSAIHHIRTGATYTNVWQVLQQLQPDDEVT